MCSLTDCFCRIGLDYFEGEESHIGYLANVKPTTHIDMQGEEVAAVILYFIKEDGSWMKGVKIYAPYFFVQCDPEVIG